MRISLIVAVSENGVIGRAGKLPWHLADDLKRFKRLTMGHTIIMGRKTWESIGRPLPGRRMIVVSRQAGFQTGFAEVAVVSSTHAALELAADARDDEVYIIGGGELYREALPRTDRLFITRVQADVEGDTFFPEVDWKEWSCIELENRDADANNDFAQQFQVLERRGSNTIKDDHG